MKNKNWKIPLHRPEMPQELLSAGYTPLLSAAMALRGIKDAASATEMLDGGSECLCDPMLIMGMDKARDRVLRAIEKKEKTAVFGDYDVDGITSTCLVTDYLRSKGLECLTYIPDRNEEGYGLNCSALDKLKAQGVCLVISVDCGITAADETRHAHDIGLEMVITDHHECKGVTLPYAAAVIDCKQAGDTYPNPHLAGVGMALKLVCACEGDSDKVLDNYADLVAIGTVADVMPLVGENRYLVRRGLKMLENPQRPGIAAMLREAGVSPAKLTASSIGFSLAPRLNAAGRLGHAETAVRLLMSEDDGEASRLATELCELNRKRQSIETQIWEEANVMLDGVNPEKPIILASDKWHQGVIGIAASKLAEQYSLPSIMICINGDVGKGSCRSFGGFNIFEALSACSEHLIGFGGHALAAGLNIRTDKLDDFKAAMAEYFSKNRPNEQPEVQCDLLINEPSLLTIDNVRSLDRLEPYGNMNPKPVMCMYGVTIESMTAVGNGRHLKMRVLLDNTPFECIFFSHTSRELNIHEGSCVDIAFTPQINDFRGHISVQLLISSAAPHNSEALCRAILDGDNDALYAAWRFCPGREDFVRAWRTLSSGERVGDTISRIIAQTPAGMLPEKYCLCLEAFREVGLLRNQNGGIYGAEKAEIDGKADLDATIVERTLRSYRKECAV